ncbi:MAG: LSm family protein [Candidatus Pacearchaeota archaeon]
MANGIDRPLDLLNNSRDKEILIQLKNGKQMVGKLKAFDVHVNIVLDNAKEIEDGQQTKSLGLTFVRGDTIIFISPATQ